MGVHILDSKEELDSHFSKHHLPSTECGYKGIFAWELSSAKAFPEPSPHLRHQGARKWIALEFPQEGKKAREFCRRLAKSECSEELHDLAEKAGVRDFGKSGNPFFRVKPSDAAKSDAWKLFYVKDAFESERRAVFKAAHLCWRFAQIKDQYVCCSLQKLKETCKKFGLCLTGSGPELVDRIVAATVKHYRSKMVKDADEAVEKGLHDTVGSTGDDAGAPQKKSTPEKKHDDKKKKTSRVNASYLVLLLAIPVRFPFQFQSVSVPRKKGKTMLLADGPRT